MAEITLKPGEKTKIGSFEMELAEIMKKRMEFDPETGKGGDEEMHLRVVLREGGETSEIVLEYPRATQTEFRGHKITLLEVESFQEWAKFRVEIA